MTAKGSGYLVVFAGFCINLAFGILYAWSIFSSHLIEKYDWSSTQAALPYTFAIFMFAFLMIPGGILQDRLGARVVVSIAAVLIGGGLFAASIFNSPLGITVSFGLLAGAGIGLGYSATTPIAIKWFPPEKKGLVTGIVVTGFGLASLYIAPLTTFMLASYGLINSFRFLGILFGIVVFIFAQFLRNPAKDDSRYFQKKMSASVDYDWKAMIRTKQFYQLWVMFAAGSLAGLMLIGHLSKIAVLQTGANTGYILVAAVAVFNALGRPVAGVVSDKIGRVQTMIILYILQGITLLAFQYFNSFYSVLAGAAIITFSYGAMLAVYPSTIGDQYGTKHLGFNYGILFTAWGVGGLVGPLLAAMILDSTGGYLTAYIVAAFLCFFAAFVGWNIKDSMRRDTAK